MKIEVAVLLGVAAFAYVLYYLLARSICRASWRAANRSTKMETTAALLHDDVLADILRRLPLRSLAVARSVCKAWRAAVDGRALLPLLHPVRGVFVNYVDHDRPHLFARPSPPSAVPRIDDLLDFIPEEYREWWSVLDHCNGLLLCRMEWARRFIVCNPATRQWTPLPQRAGAERGDYEGAYLVFDPAESPHYEVVLVPAVPKKPPPPDKRKVEEERRALLQEQEKDAPFCLDWFFSLPDGAVTADDDNVGETQDDEEFQQLPSVEEPDDDPCRLMEWPPAPWTLQIFSSRTGRWEERAFVREGEPAGTVQDMRLDPASRSRFYGPRQWYAVYLQGTLYVHCQGSFVARISLSDDKYQVIKAPANIRYTKPYLGRLENGVCFGLTHECQLRIWTLNESYGKMEWVMKYEDDLMHCAKHVGGCSRDMHGAWIVKEKDTVQKESSDEWDSDNYDIFEVKDDVEFYPNHFNILGFHPYKEVVFLVEHFGVVAYHLDASKVQYLGYARPKCYYHSHCNGVYESFVYTPCMIQELDERSS